MWEFFLFLGMYYSIFWEGDGGREEDNVVFIEIGIFYNFVDFMFYVLYKVCGIYDKKWFKFGYLCVFVFIVLLVRFSVGNIY